MSGRRRLLFGLGVILVVAAGVVVVLELLGKEPGGRDATALGPMRFQAFEVDPGWDARNNRRLGRCVTTRQDFGPLPEGRGIGGLITRNARQAWYGRPVRLGFDRPFTATGELVVRGTEPEPFPHGSVMVGFFNQGNRDWRPPNLLAFQANADTVGGGDYWISLSYGARNWEQANVAYGGDESPAGLRFGRAYAWRLAYDPRADGGRGRVTLSIPAAGPPVALTLAPGARRAGARLDRFGVGNQVLARGEGLAFELRRLAVDGVPQSPGQAGGAWGGVGNRAEFRDCLTGQPNSFGWTGPRDRRLGGLVARTDEEKPELRAFYADRVGRLTLEDRLHAEGTVQLDRANSDSATLLGWFRAGASGEGSGALAPPGFVGIVITGPSRIGQYFRPMLADRRGEVAGDDRAGIVFNPGPGRHRWSFDYYPAARRNGEIVVRLGGRRLELRVPGDLRRTGAVLNRFGLRNLERGGSFQVVRFDDLRYSIGARPGGGGRDSPERGAPRGGY